MYSLISNVVWCVTHSFILPEIGNLEIVAQKVRWGVGRWPQFKDSGEGAQAQGGTGKIQGGGLPSGSEFLSQKIKFVNAEKSIKSKLINENES